MRYVGRAPAIQLSDQRLLAWNRLQDTATAFSLFRKASEGGHADAHYSLAKMYLDVSDNSIRTTAWLNDTWTVSTFTIVCCVLGIASAR